MYAQVIYALGRVPVPAKEKPEIKEVEPFKTLLTGDLEKVAKLSMEDLEKILAATLTGMTTEQFHCLGDHLGRRGNGPPLEAALNRARLPADEGDVRVLPRQRPQDLHCHPRRPGFRVSLFRGDLRHPAGAGGRRRQRYDLHQ